MRTGNPSLTSLSDTVLHRLETTGRESTSTPAIQQSHLQREFEELLSRHRPKIILYLFSLVRQTADAEDLCQRCSLVMWNKFPEYDRQRSFLAWACGIARHEALNHRRAVAANRLLFQSDVAELLAVSLESLDQAAEKQRLSALEKCVQALPDLEQSLLQQIYREGAAFEAVARELGCSLKTFYNRMSLLRRRLSRCVARRLKLEMTE